MLIAVYVYSAWDGTVYVNEEVKHRRINPGRAAIWAVALLTILYTLAQVGLQGVVSPARLQANASTALVYVAQALGGSGWAKVMALSVALSVIAATGTGIVLTARIVYGMASHRTLPDFLSSVSRRFSTPVAASVTAGILVVALTWVYMLATSVKAVFADVVAVAGLLFAAFYIMTALATVVFCRHQDLRQLLGPGSPRHLAAGCSRLPRLGFWCSHLRPHLQVEIWSVVAIVVVGLVMMVVARTMA